MSADFRDLAIGDWVLLTGEEWGANTGKTVAVERINTDYGARQAWNDSVPGVGSLTDGNGYGIGGGYQIERVATKLPPEPAKPTTQGYTLSLYVSRSVAAEFPGETQELASITISHESLGSLLSQGKGILEVVADG
ncbi:hypothetical protein SEA_LAHQTEMISH_64 [Microbacterium phage Lahqtemish]|uniref:hypothetical protein n=1 Tax=Microbacterium phage Lahqtemish TaxID=2776867 RepID=UPI0018A673F9|nr:hypothetical protein QDW25_gp64 [Microbacterium phage Lahqtemish]QOP66655.1 hypothetical protein SEA_LAHQTEMISH_64 [Microbacterium phage Lahqtemish]